MSEAHLAEQFQPRQGSRLSEPWRELAILSLLLMDLSWITLWFQALVLPFDQLSNLRIFWVLGSVLLGFHLAARVLKSLRIKLEVRRWVLGVVAVVGYYAVLAGTSYAGESLGLISLLLRPFQSFQESSSPLPIELLVVLFVLLMGWRALVITQGYIGPGLLIASFRSGFLWFLFYGLFIVILTGEAPWIWWGLFLAAGMLGVGSARVAVLHTLRGGSRSPFNRDWLAGFLTSVLGVLGIAAVLSQLIAGVGPILVMLSVRVAMLLVAVLLIPLVLLTVWLLAFLAERFSLSDLAIAQTIAASLESLRGFVRGLGEEALNLRPYLEWLIQWWQEWGPTIRLISRSVLILAALVYIVMRIRDRSRLHAEDRDEGQVDVDAAVFWESLRRSLKDSWLAARARLSERWVRRKRSLAAERIRQIYALMMVLCEDLGEPRDPATTPWEYRSDLERLFPGLQSEIDTVTSAYVRIRYGELPEEPKELVQVEQAWDRLRFDGDRQLRESRA